MLSRSEMEAVIRKGGSIVLNSCVISTIEALPTPGEIAAMDPNQKPASLEELEAQHKAIAAQIAALKAKPEK